jgi:dihydroflavonol-4-reductase
MILVTGGTGLVGAHLLLDLTRSQEKVRAIFRKESSLKAVRKVFSYEVSEEKADRLFNSIEWVQADITDIPSLSAAFTNIRIVYHCAALVSFDSAKDSQLRKINIEGTANVVNLCISEKIEKLCFISSIATLDKQPGKKIFNERSYWNKEADHNMYSITKYGAEMEVWRASQEGVPVVVVNPGVIIGPGFWNKGSGKIFTKLNSGLSYFFPKTTGFIGVWDVVRAMIMLTNSGAENEQYVLVSENLSFKTVFEEVAQQLKVKVPSKEAKPWMIMIAWIWQEISWPFTSKERQLERASFRKLFSHSYYSSQKIKENFNFKFEAMDAVIHKTAAAYSSKI